MTASSGADDPWLLRALVVAGEDPPSEGDEDWEADWNKYHEEFPEYFHCRLREWEPRYAMNRAVYDLADRISESHPSLGLTGAQKRALLRGLNTWRHRYGVSAREVAVAIEQFMEQDADAPIARAPRRAGPLAPRQLSISSVPASEPVGPYFLLFLVRNIDAIRSRERNPDFHEWLMNQEIHL